jgi:hypothetical protein
MPPLPAALSRRAAGLAAAREAALSPPNPAAAAQHAGSLYYTSPRELVAGAPFSLFFNRRACTSGLGERPNVKLHYGFDGWTVGAEQAPVPLRPAGLHISDHEDWWYVRVDAPIPEGAAEINFVFSDGDGVFNNANGSDFALPVIGPEETEAAAALAATLDREGGGRPLRDVASHETHVLAGGTLHVITLAPRKGVALSVAEARAARWQEEKTLRVWTPAGFNKEAPPPGGYPVLYMSDAQVRGAHDNRAAALLLFFAMPRLAKNKRKRGKMLKSNTHDTLFITLNTHTAEPV